MTSNIHKPKDTVKSSSPIKVTHLLHTMAYGGIETVIINWLSNVPKEKLDVQVVVFANPSATEDHFVKHAEAAGLVVEKIPWARSKPIFKAARELDVLLSNHGTQVLHMHNAYAEAVGYLSGRRNRIKMVSTIYVWAGKDFGFKRYVLQKLSAALIKRFDLLTVQCEKARQESKYWGFDQNKVKVLPSGYTLPEPSGLTATQREALREEHGANKDTIVVCNVARLYPEKGQSRMLKIWKRIVADCPHAQLWIYGIGPLEEELRTLCESLELQDSVVFQGFANNLLLELELCDVQLHPSYNEGIPIAICAGMAAGSAR